MPALEDDSGTGFCWVAHLPLITSYVLDRPLARKLFTHNFRLIPPRVTSLKLPACILGSRGTQLTQGGPSRCRNPDLYCGRSYYCGFADADVVGSHTPAASHSLTFSKKWLELGKQSADTLMLRAIPNLLSTGTCKLLHLHLSTTRSNVSRLYIPDLLSGLFADRL